MPGHSQITGIILAGGKSSRMGEDKGLLEISGKKLIEFAIEKLEIICERVIISSNSASYLTFNKEVISDNIQDIGPMGGISACLDSSKTEFNLVISVDMPMVNLGLLTYLIDQCKGFYAAVPFSGNEHYEPLCASYHISILPKINDFISNGNYKLPDLFRQIKINPLEISQNLPFFTADLFRNINTREDLELAQKLINSSK